MNPQPPEALPSFTLSRQTSSDLVIILTLLSLLLGVGSQPSLCLIFSADLSFIPVLRPPVLLPLCYTHPHICSDHHQFSSCTGWGRIQTHSLIHTNSISLTLSDTHSIRYPESDNKNHALQPYWIQPSYPRCYSVTVFCYNFSNDSSSTPMGLLHQNQTITQNMLLLPLMSWYMLFCLL